MVVFHEMGRRLRVEKLRVGMADDALRPRLLRVVRERLVAGQIDAGLRVLGKVQPRHVVQEGRQGLLQLGHLFGFLQQPLLLVGLPLRLQLLQQEENDDEEHRREAGYDAEPVFPEDLHDGDLTAVMGIGSKGGIHILALCQDHRLIQYEIQLPVRPVNRKGKRHDFTGGHGKEPSLIQVLLDVIEAVIADEDAVRPAGGDRLETRAGARAADHPAVGIVVLDERLDIHVAFIDGEGEIAVPGNVAVIRGAHDGLYFRFHRRGGQAQPHLVRVIGAEADRKHAIHFPGFHGADRRLRRGIGHRLKTKARRLQVVRGMGEVILERARQFARLRVCPAERQIILPIPDADRAVLRNPVLLPRRQERVRLRDG